MARSTLNDAIAQTARRNERVLTPIDPAAAIARQRTTNNLAGAMGGPFVGGPMQMARMAGLNEYQVQEAGILGMAAQDAIGMKGTGASTRLASGVRRTGEPRLIPNAALEAELILQGNASRARIVGEIGKAAQPSIDALMKLDPNAQVGFRGSLASGLKGEHKIDAYGNRVAFDGEVAFQLNRARQYVPYTKPQGYDVDLFVVSDKLAAQLGNSKGFMDAADLSGGMLVPTFDAFGRSLQANPALLGMKPGDTTFRVFNQDTMGRKLQGGDAQIYLLTGGSR